MSTGSAKHFSDEELGAEWSRAAYVIAVHGGPFTWARHIDTIHRFLTTPHYDKEPEMTTSVEAPETTVAAYEASLSPIPAVRIPFRVNGFRRGWHDAKVYAEHLAPADREERFQSMAREYDGSMYLDGIAVARRRTSHNGYQDGWNAALGIQTGAVSDS